MIESAREGRYSWRKEPESTGSGREVGGTPRSTGLSLEIRKQERGDRSGGEELINLPACPEVE